MKYSVNSVWENKDEYDVVVVGAGHAGCEAALACARLGIKTIIFTVSVDSIALMPCNPNIGGSSKGHLVKEVDALGGEMGKVIDQTFIQSKMLNKSKGPAVHSLRAQADKANYSKTMRMVLENQENLEIKQAEVTDILAKDGKIDSGVFPIILGLSAALCMPSAFSYANASDPVAGELVQSVQQGRTVTGKIIDDTGEPLIGVSVLVKGTTVGTITDFDGNYSLEVPSGKHILVISYI